MKKLFSLIIFFTMTTSFGMNYQEDYFIANAVSTGIIGASSTFFKDCFSNLSFEDFSYVHPFLGCCASSIIPLALMCKNEIDKNPPFKLGDALFTTGLQFALREPRSKWFLGQSALGLLLMVHKYDFFDQVRRTVRNVGWRHMAITGIDAVKESPNGYGKQLLIGFLLASLFTSEEDLKFHNNRFN